MRKLVTIRKVSNIEPIPEADRIELAQIDGWKCIVRKGEFTIGDTALYFEIDSFIPEDDSRFKFLENDKVRTHSDGSKGYRIKSKKMKGVLSQGLLLPLSEFPECTNNIMEDYSDLLKIKVWEAPIPVTMRGTVKNSFPGFIRKTDQERIQNLPEFFDLYKDVEFEETEKLDGTSCTVYCIGDQIGVCSRNLEFKENGDDIYWKTIKDSSIDVALKNICKDINLALQGEIIGPGIQKNLYKLQKHEFRLFDIWDIDNQCYLTHSQRKEAFLDLSLMCKIEHVPFIRNTKIFSETTTMNELLNYSSGYSLIEPSLVREGIVFKSFDGKVSFKVINNIFLFDVHPLKEDKK